MRPNPPKKSRPRDLPRPLKAIILINVMLACCFVAFWATAARDGELWRADFTSFYTSWAMIRDGDGARLYDLGLQARYQQQILEGRSFKDGLLPFVNPPHSALPFLPLALLSRAAAHAVWMLLNLALLAYLLRRLLILADGWSGAERLALLTATLALHPLYVTFLVGAFSLLIAVCLLNAYLALRDGKDRQAALWLFIGSIKFQLVLLPAIWLLGARRWRAVGMGAILGAAAFLGAALALGGQIWSDYLAVLRQFNAAYDFMGIHPESTYSLKGGLLLLLGRPYASQVTDFASAVLVAAAGGALWLGAAARKTDRGAQALSFGLAILLGLVFNLHMYEHDLLSVLVAGALGYAFLRERGPALAGPRRAYATAILAAPLIFFISEAFIGTRLGVQIPLVMLFALLGWQLWLWWKAKRGMVAPAGYPPAP